MVKLARSLVLASMLVTLAACAREAAAPAPQPVLSSADDARAFTTRFFQAYVSGDANTAADMLCTLDPASLERARRFIERSQRPGSPYRVETFTVRSIGTHWIQREPYFRVEVSFPTAKRDGEVLHAYTLRAKDGCMEGFLDGGAPPRGGNANAPEREHEDLGARPSSPKLKAPREEEPSPSNGADEVIEL